MAFLDWFRENPDTEATQMSLLGDHKDLAIRQRVDGATVQKDLQKEVHSRGGDDRTSMYINETVTRNMLGCSSRQIYRETGGKQSDRSTLPTPAQEALMVGDVAAKHEMVKRDAQGHTELIDAANDASKTARKLFPW